MREKYINYSLIVWPDISLSDIDRKKIYFVALNPLGLKHCIYWLIADLYQLWKSVAMT